MERPSLLEELKKGGTRRDNIFNRPSLRLEYRVTPINAPLPLRVIIHGHKPDEKRADTGKVVQLAESVAELLKLAENKLGKRGSVIHMEDGSQVEDLDALRDNDHLFVF
ncbi:hypothetical protein L1987_72416 [Smallanthus sonchifolius]|uniref:Uncharacterized protein n=1 Tax=Smallanthus sonchifolius TaxID=185202 RepID=A0ACB9AZK5_9ASTR|nr:hypothetical protein L1987_72416 [Smallanthus sonchifolius]